MLSNAVILFREYMGTGLIVIWFLLSLCYLFGREKRKSMRVLFVYVPIVLLALFFNPLFEKIVYQAAGSEIYYRILWLLPVSIVIAYGAVDVYGRLKGKMRIMWSLVAAVLIMVSGSFIYSNSFFHKAENRYHVPRSVVDICDAIKVEGREVMAVFPAEMLQYVRQYSGVVCMPYGREILVEQWNHLDDLYDIMEAETTDAAELAEMARERECVYIILRQNKSMKGSLMNYDFEVFGEMDGYIIYKDSLVQLSL